MATTYFNTIRIMKITERNNAITKFRSIFVNTLAKYHFLTEGGIYNLLREELPAHAMAIEEFRFFVKSKDRDNYQKAWNNYCFPIGNYNYPTFEDYYIGNNYREIFYKRINEILKFAEI